LLLLGNVHFVGNFNYTASNFKAKGTLASSLGGMYADIALISKKGEPGYKGNVQTKTI
jgi:hypothetical protein